MVPHINKIVFDGVEMLPDIIDTPLWEFFDIDRGANAKKSDRQLAGLYKALAARENYFQINVPTAFGNPDYSFLCGIVNGFLQAMDADEEITGEHIIIRRNQIQRKILVIDKLNRPRSYYESVKDNKETRRALGF